MEQIIISTSYFEKQKAFKYFVDEIRDSLNSKEYLQKGYTIDDFIKIKWNISKAQAYRYLICGRVLDQLKEFEIQPSHERLCRSLNNVAKTSAQLKLLWSTVIRKYRPEKINSTHITKTWKELCKDEKYSNICHYEDSILKKVENSVNKASYEMKCKQLKQNKQKYQIKTEGIPSISYILSPALSEVSISNQSDNKINIPLSPLSDCSLNMSYNPYLVSYPQTKSINYLLLSNNEQYESQPQPQPQPQLQQPSLIYYQDVPQQILYYC